LIKPSPEVVKALGATVRQYPVLLTWIQDWREHELKSLPSVANNVAIAQGRCQVLGELSKLATEAPELAAKSK